VAVTSIINTNMGGLTTGPNSCILQFATTNTRGGVGRQARHHPQVDRRAITNATQRASDSSDTEHQSAAAPPTPASILQPLVQGKRFTCTGCADCCTGKVASGEVWLNDAEGAAIALHLGISFDAFLQRYTKNYARRPGWRLLKLQGGSQDCIFLKDKLCTIYGVRPLQVPTTLSLLSRYSSQ
jgi:Putative zinc- or iron-chelating domain